MTLGKDIKKVRVQIFIENRAGDVWVPYKTLIGYGKGSQVIIDDRGECAFDSREFHTKDEALSHAKQRASDMLADKFPATPHQDIEWEFVQEPM